MEYTLTEHAEKRVKKRKIQPEWISATLEHPARIEGDKQDPALVHVLRPIPERGFKVLRVIYNEAVEPVAIVTAYFDDRVRDL